MPNIDHDRLSDNEHDEMSENEKDESSDMEHSEMSDTENNETSDTEYDETSDTENDEMSDTENDETSDTENDKTLTPEKQKKVDIEVIKCIIEYYERLSTTSEEGQVAYIKLYNPGYRLPLTKVLTKKILPEMYNKSLEEQLLIVEQGAETICLSVDRWTSVKHEEPVIAITAHFITQEYKFKSVFIKCSRCEHTSEDIQFFLMEMCFGSRWKIAGKINWCVTDNGADMVEAINSLEWNQRSCMAYKLNLVLLNSFKSCKKIILNVKRVVRYINKDYNVSSMLNERQHAAGVEPMILLESVRTDWTTKYDMVERFITLKYDIKAILAKLKDNPYKRDIPNITNEDWIKWELFCKVFKPFQEATKELIVDKYAPASKEIAIVNGLKDVIRQLRQRPDYYNSFKDVIECIEKELEDKFGGIETEPNLAMCTILDPRYKMSVFLDESAANMAKLNLVAEVEQLLKDGKASKVLSETEAGQDKAKSENLEELSLWRRRNILKRRQSAKLEVESYMQEDLTDTDPCKWWQNNESKFPNLAKLFRTKCNKVATSVPNDELFTQDNIDLCNRKKRYAQKKADMIMFLHHNLDEDDYMRLMPEIGDDLRMPD